MIHFGIIAGKMILRGPIVKIITRRQLNWCGHIFQMESKRIIEKGERQIAKIGRQRGRTVENMTVIARFLAITNVKNE